MPSNVFVPCAETVQARQIFMLKHATLGYGTAAEVSVVLWKLCA